MVNYLDKAGWRQLREFGTYKTVPAGCEPLNRWTVRNKDIAEYRAIAVPGPITCAVNVGRSEGS